MEWDDVNWDEIKLNEIWDEWSDNVKKTWTPPVPDPREVQREKRKKKLERILHE